MKKYISLFLVLVMLLVCGGAASAEDLGIQVIGGPGAATTPMSLDDLQLGQTYTIDGYAKITPVEYLTVDCFAQFHKDADYGSVGGNSRANSGQVFVDKLNNDYYYNWRWWDAGWADSGLNADFSWLMMNVTNIQKKSVNFLEHASVKVVYQDEYEFAGWVRQVNYDYINQGSQGRDVSRLDHDGSWPNVVVLNPANVESIDMLYKGTYVFGATLPNSVFEDTKSPLSLIITLDENELTYHIRK